MTFMQGLTITVFIVNCRCIRNKAGDLASPIYVSNPCSVIGTEPWLDSNVVNLKVFPHDCDVHRKYKNSHGGGDFLLTHTSLNSVPVDIDGLSWESVWCTVPTTNAEFMTIVSFDKPRNADPILSLGNTLSALTSENVLLGGDINLPYIRWSDCPPTLTNS